MFKNLQRLLHGFLYYTLIDFITDTTREREHAFTIECKETDANFPDQNVQRHSVTSLGTALSLANGPSWGGGGAEG